MGLFSRLKSKVSPSCVCGCRSGRIVVIDNDAAGAALFNGDQLTGPPRLLHGIDGVSTLPYPFIAHPAGKER